MGGAADEDMVICQFDDDQILKWAETYIAEEGSGDAECFVAWIHTCVGTG